MLSRNEKGVESQKMDLSYDIGLSVGNAVIGRRKSPHGLRLFFRIVLEKI